MVNEKKLPESIVSAFAMGTLFASIYYSLVNSYYNFYVTDIALVPAADLGTASFVVRLVFVFLCPVLAALVQNGHSKFGKYRKWIFVGVPIAAVATILTFTKFSGSGMFLAVFYSITYTVSSGASSLCGNAQMSLMNVITDDPDQQRRLSTRRSQFQDASKILFSATFLPLVALLGGGDDGLGYHRVAIVIAILHSIGYLATAWSGKKYDIYDKAGNVNEEAKKDKMSVKQMVDCVIKNPALICMLIAETLKFTAFMVFISTFAYYYQYILFDFSAITITTTIASVVALGSSLVAPVIIKALGPKNSNMLAMGCYVIGMLVPRFLPPDAVIFGVGFCLIYFGMSMNACAAPLQFVHSSLAYQAKTGLNATGFVMSLYVFPVQLGIALSSGIANWLLAGMGYTAGATLTAAQAVSMQNIILLIPALMSLAALVANAAYPLSKKKMDEVYSKLN